VKKTPTYREIKRCSKPQWYLEKKSWKYEPI